MPEEKVIELINQCSEEVQQYQCISSVKTRIEKSMNAPKEGMMFTDFEVEYEGKPYRYGTGWIPYDIPETDLNKIKDDISANTSEINIKYTAEHYKDALSIINNKDNNIDAIIGLGRNLFYNSGLESFIMICNNNKPKERKGNILFIEAEKLTHKEGKQAYLHREDIENIVNAYYNPNDIIGLSKYVCPMQTRPSDFKIASFNCIAL